MKNPFETAETFNAWMQIPMWYDFLKRVYDKWTVPASPIVGMVHEATGYDKKLEQDFAKEAIECLNHIIKFKKVLEHDTSKDEAVIREIESRIGNTENPT